jgi:hypothetical protein
MLLVVAKMVVVAAAIYFLLLGAIALARPTKARAFLLGFADTSLKHYVELAIRLIVGGAMLLVARDSTYPTALAVFGWILVVSTAFMALMPWRLHHRFAQSAVPRALRYLPLIGVSSLIMGGLLFWVAVAGNAA